METHYNVVIVGAGLVGLTLACLLVKQNLRVAIIETGKVQPPQLENNHYQLRVSAINLACEDMFSDLNIWQKMTATRRFSPYEKMFVWDSVSRGQITFDCTHIAESCLGYIIENAVMYQALLHELSGYSEVTILDNRQPTAVTLNNKGIELYVSCSNSLENRQEIIRAELLVGADGAASWVREYANIASYSWPYHHEALVTTVMTECPHQKTAWQCFLREGPLALLPLYEQNVCSIVWSAPPHEIKRLQELEEQSFNREISNAFEYKLGAIKQISRQATFPLTMRHAKRYITNRVALLGDAAHTIHPLAGQGINLGFADALSLAECILQAKQKFNDCGEYSLLRKYERDRKSDNWIMIFGMESFKRLFENQSLMTVYMRGLGLGLVNKTDFIKNQFIYRALGCR